MDSKVDVEMLELMEFKLDNLANGFKAILGY